MKYNQLANTDIKVSQLCLGTMTWGQQNTEAEGHEQMDYALEQGINFFDTAELYPVPAKAETLGATESIIGTWFKKTGHREKIVLATKIAGKAAFTEHIRSSGFQKEALNEAIESSLKRLRTDYIDLYQLHWPERNTNYFGKRGFRYDDGEAWKDNIREVLETLDNAIKAGKIRHIGISNETPWGAMRFLEESKQLQLPRPLTVQNPYSLLNRQFEVGMAEVSHRENLPLLAYSPLAFGVLSGKYLGGKMPEKARITLFPNYKRYSSVQCENATEKYADIAKAQGLSLTQMALAFVNSRPFLCSNIIGATNVDQLKENIASIDIELSEDLLQQIEAVHDEIPNPAP